VPVLRHVAEQLRAIDDLNIPFQRGELQRHQQNADHAADAHRGALAARDDARAARDRAGGELQALHPWRPFTGRRRHELETANRTANRQLAHARHHIDTTRAQLERAEERLDRARLWLTRHEPEQRHRPGLAAALERDLNARNLNAASGPPPRWADLTLGPRPNHNPTDAAVWDHTVAAVGQYRDIWSIIDDYRPLGPRPNHYSDPRRHDWQHAASSLAAAGRQLGCGHDFNQQLRLDIGLYHDRGMGISR
jgi:hypothetical protein